MNCFWRKICLFCNIYPQALLFSVFSCVSQRFIHKGPRSAFLVTLQIKKGTFLVIFWAARSGCFSPTELSFVWRYNHICTSPSPMYPSSPTNLRGCGTRLMLQSFNLEYMHRSWSYLTTKLWNCSPTIARECPDLAVLGARCNPF